MKSGTSLDRSAPWSESYVSAPRSSKRRAASTMAQAELWPATDVAEAAPQSAAEMPVTTPAPVMETTADTITYVDVPRTLKKSKPLNKSIGRRVAVARPVAVVTRPPASVGQSIARFLNVNGAIEGMRSGEIRFDLPGRRLSNTLRLLKGTPEMDAYTPVYF